MLQATLIETLALLRPEELARFHKFVRSPYFNDGPYSRDTTGLLEYLLPYAPSFSDAAMSIQNAHASLYPGKPFVEGKIQVVMSKLNQLLKQFAAQCAEDIPEMPENLRLAAFFIDRGAAQRAAPLLEKLQSAQKKSEPRDASHWTLRFWTQVQMHRLDTHRQNNNDRENLSEAIRCLHHAYLVQSLLLLNDLFFSSRKTRIDDPFAESLAQNIPTLLQIAGTENEPLLRLMSQGFEFARNPATGQMSDFEHFLQDLRQHEAVLPPLLLVTLYGYARNYCTWHSNRGDARYLPLLFEVFQHSLDQGLLLTEGKIMAATLLNMVQAGFAAGQMAWVKQALERCRYQITGVSDVEGFYYYNLANWHYHQKDYEAALDLIPQASDGLFNGLMLRKLEIKIYYETDSPLLESKVDNFKLFIFRQGKKNLVEDIFLMNNAFIDMLRSMMATGSAGNDKRVQKLREKLAKTQLIAERKWLEGQLSRLST